MKFGGRVLVLGEWGPDDCKWFSDHGYSKSLK